jgi:uncharacterized protein YqjF (DUF2071 family)
VSELGILGAAARQARAVDQVGHRPWPLPERPWSQAQTRVDSLLAFWPVAPLELARTLPPELAIDTFEGEAWVGVSAALVANLRLRGLPPVPGLASSGQLEVRTPVVVGDRPGNWLLSLELGNAVLVEAAKRTQRLPAQRARIDFEEEADGVRFSAERDGLAFLARYAAVGEAAQAAPGSLESFLVERYALYTADGGRLYRADLHHAPWRLQPATVSIEVATLAPVALEGPPLALYAAEQDVLAWSLEEL